MSAACVLHECCMSDCSTHAAWVLHHCVCDELLFILKVDNCVYDGDFVSVFRRILRCFDYATVNHWIGVINFKSRLQFNENYGQGGFTSLQPICIQLACEVCRKQSQACRNECLRRGPIPFASICIHLYPFARCEPGGFETKVEPEEPAEAIFYPICFAILFIPETSGDNSSDIFEMFTVVLFSFLTQAWENNSWEPSVQNQSGSQNWEEGRSFWHALGPSWTLNKWTNPEDSGRCTFCRTMIYRDLPRFMLFPFW